MDFGLAKLKGSLKLTRTSSTVGTLAYMAPEQIQGGEVDARSDIFSFGAVLYEMFTGHMPFRGEHEAAMMYSILNEEPASLLGYRPELPPELDRIIRRALEKDPEDRYQSVADMVSELKKVVKQSTRVVRPATLHPAGSGAEAGGALQAAAEKARHRSRPAVLSIIGLAVILVAAVMYFLVFRPRSVELNPDMTFRTLQISFSQVSYPSLSADGNWIAFPAADVNGKWDIYYMNVTAGEPRRVTFDSSANPYGNAAEISPDGGVIAYDRYNAKRNTYDAYVVPSIGGRSKRVAERTRSPRWRQDGKRIGYIDAWGRGISIWSVKPDGSDRRLEVSDTLTSDWGRVDFDWSPDGASVVWLRSFPEGHQEIVRAELGGGGQTQLTHGRSNIDEVCWTSNDQIIFSSNRSGNTNLWMVSASGGRCVQITKGSGPDIGMSLSADGRRLLYLQSQEAGHLWRSSIDGRSIRQLTTDERSITWPSFSPDGKQIAFGMSDNDPLKSTRHIYVCDRDGSNRRQITTGDEFANWPTWSPDGRWISYYRMESAQISDSGFIHIVEQADPGPPRPLGRGLYSRWLDMTTLVIANPFRDKASIVALDGTSRSMAYQDSAILWPILDGRHVLLRDHHAGREGWYVVAARNNQVTEGAKPRKLFTRGHPPNLSPDGKYFYFCADLRF